MFKITPISKRPSIKGLMTVTLLAAALGLAGCSNSTKRPAFAGSPTQPGGPGGPGTGGPGEPGGPGGPGGPGNGSEPRQGALETALGNTGDATDQLIDAGLGNDLGVLGKQLDNTLEPITTPLVGLTQRVGGATGLDTPVTHITSELGSTVINLSDVVDGTGLPLNLDSGLAGLLSGVGGGVQSAGGILDVNTGDAYPLTSVLGHTTEGVIALTDALGQSILGDALGKIETKGALLRPLTDALAGTLGVEAGDGLLTPVTNLTGHVLGDGNGQTGLLPPITATVGDIVNNVASGNDLLSPVTGITDGLLGGSGNEGLLAPATDLVGGILGGGQGQQVGLLAPVTDTVGGILGNNPAQGGGLLAPVTDAVGGILGGGTPPSGGGGGLLAPVTGVVGGITGGNPAQGGGLLAPVTSVVEGVTGNLPGGSGSDNGLLSPVTNLLGGVLGSTSQ